MILHIVVDDKFIDNAYTVFEEASPGNNIFLLVGEKGNFVYIKETPIKIVSKQMFLSKSFAKSLVKFLDATLDLAVDQGFGRVKLCVGDKLVKTAQ